MFFSLCLFKQRSKPEKINDFFASIDRKKSSLSPHLISSIKIRNSPDKNLDLFQRIRIYSRTKMDVSPPNTVDEGKEREKNHNKDMP